MLEYGGIIVSIMPQSLPEIRSAGRARQLNGMSKPARTRYRILHQPSHNVLVDLHRQIYVDR